MIFFSPDHEQSEEYDSDDEAKNDTCESVTEEKSKLSIVCYGCSESRILYHFIFVTRFIWMEKIVAVLSA